MDNTPLETDDFELIFITPEEAGERLDKILQSRYQKTHSRSYFQYLIEENKVLVNGQAVKKRYAPKANDEVQIHYILTPEIGLTPENIPLDILFEDEHILAVNKPAGMVVHPAPGHSKGTFVNALLFHCDSLLSQTKETLRPGIVHRLDKDTSGILLAAKTTKAHQRLIELFSSREIYKEYLAICCGNPGNRLIETAIGRHPVYRQKMKAFNVGEGKLAISQCQTLTLKENLSLVQVILKTGRTHQIRVHMQYLNTPILGDALYGNAQINKKYQVDRQLLHAYKIQFKHPINNKLLEIKAEPPKDFQYWINKLSDKTTL